MKDMSTLLSNFPSEEKQKVFLRSLLPVLGLKEGDDFEEIYICGSNRYYISATFRTVRGNVADVRGYVAIGFRPFVLNFEDSKDTDKCFLFRSFESEFNVLNPLSFFFYRFLEDLGLEMPTDIRDFLSAHEVAIWEEEYFRYGGSTPYPKTND